MPKFNRLRGLGPLGTATANILTFITTNWGLAVSVIVAAGAASIDWLRDLALTPATYVGIGVFLAVLWTTIGITVLIDRRRPRIVQTHTDYRWGLTFEGFLTRYIGASDPSPEPGALHFGVLLRNYLPGPVRYEFEHIDIRIGTRAIPRILPGTLFGFMTRGAGRTSTIRGFVQGELKEFWNKTEATIGSAEFWITYGPAEGPPVRRLKMRLETHMLILQDGNAFGWQDNIISEIDEPFSR
jgi:hypothetical protein